MDYTPAGTNRMVISGRFNQDARNTAQDILFTLDDSLVRRPGFISGGNFPAFNKELEKRFRLDSLQKAATNLEFILNRGYYSAQELFNAYAVEMKFGDADLARTFTLSSALYEGSVGWVVPPKFWKQFGGPKIFADIEINASYFGIEDLVAEWRLIAQRWPTINVNVSFCAGDNVVCNIFVRGGEVVKVLTEHAKLNFHDAYVKSEFGGMSIDRVKNLIYPKRPSTDDKNAFAAYEQGWTEAEYEAYSVRSVAAILNVMRKT